MFGRKEGSWEQCLSAVNVRECVQMYACACTYALTYAYYVIRDSNNAHISLVLFITLCCRLRVQLVPSVLQAPLVEKERRVSKEEMQGQAQPVKQDARSVPREI